MKAGRELDALVAEKVMGWSRKELPTNKVNPSYTAWYWVSDDDSVKIPTNFFNPSFNLSDAWKVVEKLNYKVKVTKNVIFEPKYQAHVFVPSDVKMVYADTAPLAICLVALKAVGVEVDC